MLGFLDGVFSGGCWGDCGGFGAQGEGDNLGGLAVCGLFLELE